MLLTSVAEWLAFQPFTWSWICIPLMQRGKRGMSEWEGGYLSGVLVNEVSYFEK